MVLYDTPGVIEKKMHKLDSMMMKNVRSAGINADCVVVLVDACKAPEKVCFLLVYLIEIVLICSPIYFFFTYFLVPRLMKCWKKVLETSKMSCLYCWY